MVQKEEPTMLKSITRNRARRHVVTQAVAILEIVDRHAMRARIAAIEKAEKPATAAIRARMADDICIVLNAGITAARLERLFRL